MIARVKIANIVYDLNTVVFPAISLYTFTTMEDNILGYCRKAFFFLAICFSIQYRLKSYSISARYSSSICEQ